MRFFPEAMSAYWFKNFAGLKQTDFEMLKVPNAGAEFCIHVTLRSIQVRYKWTFHCRRAHCRRVLYWAASSGRSQCLPSEMDGHKQRAYETPSWKGEETVHS